MHFSIVAFQLIPTFPKLEKICSNGLRRNCTPGLAERKGVAILVEVVLSAMFLGLAPHPRRRRIPRTELHQIVCTEAR